MARAYTNDAPGEDDAARRRDAGTTSRTKPETDGRRRATGVRSRAIGSRDKIQLHAFAVFGDEIANGRTPLPCVKSSGKAGFRRPDSSGESEIGDRAPMVQEPDAVRHRRSEFPERGASFWRSRGFRATGRPVELSDAISNGRRKAAGGPH